MYRERVFFDRFSIHFHHLQVQMMKTLELTVKKCIENRGVDDSPLCSRYKFVPAIAVPNSLELTGFLGWGSSIFYFAGLQFKFVTNPHTSGFSRNLSILPRDDFDQFLPPRVYGRCTYTKITGNQFRHAALPGSSSCTSRYSNSKANSSPKPPPALLPCEQFLWVRWWYLRLCPCYTTFEAGS